MSGEGSVCLPGDQGSDTNAEGGSWFLTWEEEV